jgi:hypothetical protein
MRDDSFFRSLITCARLDGAMISESAQQLLYVHAATRTWLPAPLLFSPEQLVSLRSHVSSIPGRVSQSQRDVASSLTRIGFAIELEARVLDGLHDVDVLAHVPGGSAVSVEFDGPTHFLQWIEPANSSRRPEPNGVTLFRNRLLQEAGHTVVSIPYFEWDALEDDAARDAYITRRFEAVRQ